MLLLNRSSNEQTFPTFKSVDMDDLFLSCASRWRGCWWVDELRFGGVLAADLALDSCLRCGGLQVTLGKLFNLNHF